MGNLSRGVGRPWFIWSRGRPGELRARALATDRAGARGSFYYVDPGPYTRTARGRSGLTKQQARAAATRWLKGIGAPVPSGRWQIEQLHPPNTGALLGSGLSGFRAMSRVTIHPANPSDILYLAGQGTVVQALVLTVATAPPSGPGSCRDTTRSDGHGVRIGKRCFDYQRDGVLQLDELAFGHPCSGCDDPKRQAAAVINVPFTGSRPPHLTQQQPGLRVFSARKGARAYRVTVAAIFPGVSLPVWEVTDVEPAPPRG